MPLPCYRDNLVLAAADLLTIVTVLYCTVLYCILYCADLPTIVTIVTCYEGKQQPDCVNCVARLRSVSGSGVQGVTLYYVKFILYIHMNWKILKFYAKGC